MCKNKIYLLFISVILVSSVMAQSDLMYEEEVYKIRKQAGFVLSVAESGTGIGGFVGWPIENSFHIGLTLDAFFLRDTDQVDYYDQYTLTPISLNKKNNAYIFDLFLTIKKRLFVEDLDDNFQPFYTAAVGPVFGMNFPEYEYTIDGKKAHDQYNWTLGGYIGAGVDITSSINYFFSIRAQYIFMPFTKVIGETKNHSMFEIRLELGFRY